MAGSVSYNGINYITVGLIDDEGKIIKGADGVSADGILKIDGDGQGSTTANITGLEAEGTAKYANNVVKRISHGAQSPKVALTMLDMPFDVAQKLKGYESDGKGGYVLTSGKKPHVALLICSTGYDGEFYYDCFANGELTEPGKNHATNTESEAEYDATFTYQALAPIADGVFLDQKGVKRMFKMYNSSDAGFSEDAMLAEVFGGYTKAAPKSASLAKK
ncbi:phage tail protein [Lactococcus garvieae subsp. garvieae]|uniref:phage tail protein n=1 Tax=Lactococcus garvieae TaxID=1363 RepID=UPI0005A7B175|nr:phage tail protein [Lactococcus garvieae]KAA8718820.1 phage tail protein [Lactococcus garvieae subsp. garvieae]MDG6191139.1 phage tail protein [Lactococcus garvieae]PCS00292.1 tail protein [Lactococcus garvieae]QPR48977.1 phage tail protein [Lactococcus garvieae]